MANKFPLLGIWICEQGTSRLLYFNQKMMQSWAGSAIFGCMHHKEEKIDLQREKAELNIP